MKFLTTFEWVRPPADHRVDRPELEAEQSVQVTGTNRPRTYQQRSYASTVQYLKQHTPLGGSAPQAPPKTQPRAHYRTRATDRGVTGAKPPCVQFHRVTAAIATGKRP